MPSFSELVADEGAYHLELDRLAGRAKGARIDTLVHEGVRFSQMLDEADALVPRLARAVADGSYRPAPARIGLAHVGGRVREVGRVSGLDFVVHAVLARVLGTLLEPFLSEHLLSYREGSSQWTAIRHLRGVANEHRNARPDPRTRGLYVLRSDVAAYAHSIPLGDDSPLFDELCDAVDIPKVSPHRAMLRRLVCPPVLDAEGKPGPPRTVGLMFGVPTTNVLDNFYLWPVDRALEKLGGTFARYGDDFMFAHEDHTVVRAAKAALEGGVVARRLKLNEHKHRVFYWNGASRPSLAWPEAEATREILFLGAAVRWEGTIALAPKKWRTMLRDLHRRIRRACALAVDPDDETSKWPKRRARAAVAVVEAAFDPTSPLALGYVPLLRDLVDDRKQLEELDYLIAKWIAEAATGCVGPRAFREVPWKWLRTEAGLRSRLALRNRGA